MVHGWSLAFPSIGLYDINDKGQRISLLPHDVVGRRNIFRISNNLRGIDQTQLKRRYQI
jgi:hypothetical protein